MASPAGGAPASFADLNLDPSQSQSSATQNGSLGARKVTPHVDKVACLISTVLIIASIACFPLAITYEIPALFAVGVVLGVASGVYAISYGLDYFAKISKPFAPKEQMLPNGNSH